MNHERDRKAWGCNRCGKKDRKGRVENIVFQRTEYHIAAPCASSGARTPTRFRSIITAYSRHMEGEQRGWKPNYHLILKKSTNPRLITEDDLFPLQSGEPRVIEVSGLMNCSIFATYQT